MSLEFYVGKALSVYQSRQYQRENGFKPLVAKTDKVYLETNAHLDNLMQKEKRFK